MYFNFLLCSVPNIVFCRTKSKVSFLNILKTDRASLEHVGEILFLKYWLLFLCFHNITWFLNIKQLFG